MSTDTTLEIATDSLEATLKLAAKIGKNLNGGDVIELVSDLGGGKTAFVRGLAKGLGSSDLVASPTFTIAREYSAERCDLHHYDFYRLSDPGVVKSELAESIEEANVCVAVEWADIVHGVMPADRLTIEIEQTGDNSRSFKFTAGENHSHLLKGLP